MEDINDTPPAPDMSLIRYPYESGEIVLRRGQSVVVYDAHSRQLSVHNASDPTLEVTQCPYCHRPMRDEYLSSGQTGVDEPGSPSSGSGHFHRERQFTDPNYFRMLAASQHPSPNPSAGPSTPRRTFVQPALRSGRSRDVSGMQEPPSGAEFLGSEPHANAGQGISDTAFSPGYFQQFFRERKELGRGGNGVVLLAEHMLDGLSLGLFACKRIPVGNDHDWLEKVLVEVKLLQKIPHPNLVAYHWVWLEDYQPSKFGPSIPCLWILQEYCNGGDLHKYVLGPQQQGQDTKDQMKARMRKQSKGELDEPQDLRGPSRLTFEEIFSFFRDITSGLHHLHSKNYIHRDLKPSNCLIQHDGNRTKVLISDFGEVQAAGAKRGSTGATGTISFCAPEVLRQDESDGAFGAFTTKSDIFSLGMIVYFMCFGRLPYSNADDINEENEDLDELRAEITKWPGLNDEPRTRPDLPEKLYRYLKILLSVDPNARPSTDEILTSIKGGVGLGEGGSNDTNTHSRVSSLDSPRIRPAVPRKQPPTSIRSGLSSLSRRVSNDGARSRSPLRQRPTSQGRNDTHSRERTVSPSHSSIVVRPRKIEASMTPAGDLPPQSPRLMLPPPPENHRIQRALLHLLHQETTLAALRVALSIAKILSLTVPCMPYAPNAWVFYPLLALAVLDTGFLSFRPRTSVTLLIIHAVIMGLSRQRERLCEGSFWLNNR